MASIPENVVSEINYPFTSTQLIRESKLIHLQRILGLNSIDFRQLVTLPINEKGDLEDPESIFCYNEVEVLWYQVKIGEYNLNLYLPKKVLDGDDLCFYISAHYMIDIAQIINRLGIVYDYDKESYLTSIWHNTIKAYKVTLGAEDLRRLELL